MMSKTLKTRATLTDRSIASICTRLAANQRVRRALPDWGRLHIDRQLPFLFLYRRPLEREDPGTNRLILGQASYLMTTWKPPQRKQIKELVRGLTTTLMPHFGAFLVIEVWSDSSLAPTPSESALSEQPAFRLIGSEDEELAPAISRLERGLKRMRILRRYPQVELSKARSVAPPGFGPFFSRSEADALNVNVMGIAVNPV